LPPPGSAPTAGVAGESDVANSGIRREPALPEHEAIVREQPKPLPEFALLDDERNREAVRTATMRRSVASVARQAAMDPEDGMAL
jgi:type IV secretion system protein VirD4